MRRRIVAGADPSGMPVHLLRYNPADWPNPDCHPECAFWAAHDEWAERHPEDDLNAPGALILIDGPDAPWHPEWI